MPQNPMQMIQMFKQYADSFRGDPKQEVERLMREGKMSQAQFNQLQQMATQFQQFMNSFNKR